MFGSENNQDKEIEQENNSKDNKKGPILIPILFIFFLYVFPYCFAFLLNVLSEQLLNDSVPEDTVEEESVTLDESAIRDVNVTGDVEEIINGINIDSDNLNNIIPDNSTDFGLELIYSGGEYKYYRDKVTDVLFLYRWSSSGISVIELSDPDTGLPLTYERYLVIYKNK